MTTQYLSDRIAAETTSTLKKTITIKVGDELDVAIESKIGTADSVGLLEAIERLKFWAAISKSREDGDMA